MVIVLVSNGCTEDVELRGEYGFDTISFNNINSS